MIRLSYVLVLGLCWLNISVFGQTKFTLSGIIKDENTGEYLIGATVSVKELPNKGTAANTYGFYSLTLPARSYEVSVQYIGYKPNIQTIKLDQSLKLNFTLTKQSSELDDVIVTSTRKNENVTQTQIGLQKLDLKELKSIPVLFGKKDVLKTIQLLPGIKSADEGRSGFSVRGEAADQNPILLDEAIVYNASHLLGFFSVFNSDVIKDVAVYKGNGPAKYGGRLSSVLDVKINNGNDKRIGVSGGIGLISSMPVLDKVFSNGWAYICEREKHAGWSAYPFECNGNINPI